MKVITVRNVNDALPRGLTHLLTDGDEESSRNGAVLVAPTPVTTVYANPQERVLFSSHRDANPFEALWMLEGRNDVAFPAHYAKQLELYSDDNETLNGAYGYRWRTHFHYDQISRIVHELRRDPTSRRCVLAMWDATDDWQLKDNGKPGYEGDLIRALRGGKDVPCNTHVYFRVRNGALEMTVCNRSNDAVWGAYGANAVHFSVLQEYIAQSAALQVGFYYQVANNFHAYKDRPDTQKLLSNVRVLHDDRYATHEVVALRLIAAHEDQMQFNGDLSDFMDLPPGGAGAHELGNYRTVFFGKVVKPMAIAHALYKEDRLQDAIDVVHGTKIDWLVNAENWLQRRAVSRAQKMVQA